ncbi:MAG: NADPH-dependent FMN reductase [Bacteroidota bacterium]|nr:NADPH-dependent FMN reductase [Bacteroidota bacterium]
MYHIAIISASVREGRQSHRVALYFRKLIEENNLATAEIVDLKEFNFPLFDERLSRQPHPTVKAILFAEKIQQADGVIIITPEYNGGYPSSLKNVIDLLYNEWHHKPVAISTSSGGPFGGAQVITSLQFSLWKMKAWTVPAMFPVPNVQDAFDEQGNPADKFQADKRAGLFLDELFWCMDAVALMNQKKETISY